MDQGLQSTSMLYSIIIHITIYKLINCTHPGQPWWVGSSLKQVRPLSQPYQPSLDSFQNEPRLKQSLLQAFKYN